MNLSTARGAGGDKAAPSQKDAKLKREYQPDHQRRGVLCLAWPMPASTLSFRPFPLPPCVYPPLALSHPCFLQEGKGPDRDLRVNPLPLHPSLGRSLLSMHALPSPLLCHPDHSSTQGLLADLPEDCRPRRRPFSGFHSRVDTRVTALFFPCPNLQPRINSLKNISLLNLPGSFYFFLFPDRGGRHMPPPPLSFFSPHAERLGIPATFPNSASHGLQAPTSHV